MHPRAPEPYGTPRVYRVLPWVRWLAAALAALGLFLTVGAVLAMSLEDEPFVPFGLVMLGLAGLMSLMGVCLCRVEVSLTPQRIEVGSLLVRGLDRAEIAGRRLVPTPNGTRVLLVPRDPRRRKVEFVAEMMSSDDVLDDWIDSLPDLDHAHTEPASAPGEGLSGAPSENAVRRGRRLVIAIEVLGGLLLAYGVLFGTGLSTAFQGPVLVTAAVLPPLALGLTWWRPTMFPLGLESKKAAPATSSVVFTSALTLSLALGGEDPTMLPWSTAVLTAVAAGLVACPLAAAADQRDKRWKPARLLLYYPFVVLYTGSLLLVVDVLWDTRATDRVAAVVVDENVRHGRRGSETYQLQVRPQTLDATPIWVDVRRSVALSVARGDIVCGVTHPGTVGLRWFRVETCPGTTLGTPDPDAAWPR